ncbi:uncharacterized protein (TIRG00374 family) [Novosphingobium sp. PhB57]|uniref:lysylphosphatidylglycerol synthase transmembrane domain-containing protein n=1 Tax=Novosphingobium sp. PhB57 TaxID=2485107 RepID=UPI0010433D80|nr:lysylphosphatidylglycerol synthase transmembrane domain-containing protein [Novosphingobium sp. PhB57]TCU54502.1 uncharacterized protein (TIRG00374 family) [Novosphingobium sp. PhB57]
MDRAAAGAGGNAGSKKGGGQLRFWLGALVGAVFLGLLWTSVDMAAVGALLARASWPPLVLALLAYGLDFLLRAWRFRVLLDPGGRQVPFGPSVAPFVASFGISDILPFRLGDVFRVYWFHRSFSLPMGHVLGAMVVERVLDLVSILMVAGLALLLVDTALPAEIVAQFRLVLLVAVGASLLVLLSPGAIEAVAGWAERTFPLSLVARIAQTARSVAGAVRGTGDPRRILGMVLLSFALWLLESLVMFGAWVSLGGEVGGALKPLVAFAFSTLGTLVPALPGHFGSYEFFGMLSYRAVGVDAEQATATILLAHLLLWLPTALFALGWLVSMRRESPLLVMKAGQAG